MKQDEIIEIARQAGIVFDDKAMPFYMAFAKLVAANEREACARLVIQSTEIPKDALRRGTGVRDNLVIAGEQIAAAIRARGEA